MRTHYFTLGIALLLLTGAVVAAEANSQQIHCKCGETFTDGVETNIDTNGDGVFSDVGSRGRVCNTGMRSSRRRRNGFTNQRDHVSCRDNR